MFVLHDVVEFRFGRSPHDRSLGADCRQLASRARRRVRDGKLRFEASRRKRTDLTERFFAAVTNGEVEQVRERYRASSTARSMNGMRPAGEPKRRHSDRSIMDCVVLTGERVALRPIHDGYVDDIERIMAEPEVARWWPRFDRARIEDELVGSEEPGETVYAVVIQGDVAGIVQATEEEDPDYRSAAIDIALGTRWHGTGIAVDALRTMARHLIEARGHHHLTIDPAAENVRAIRCYAKIGFKAVGVLRRNERGPDGTFHDTLLMDLVADELQ